MQLPVHNLNRQYTASCTVLHAVICTSLESSIHRQLHCTACSNLYITWTVNTPPVALYCMQKSVHHMNRQYTASCTVLHAVICTSLEPSIHRQLHFTACSNLYITWTINTTPVALYCMQLCVLHLNHQYTARCTVLHAEICTSLEPSIHHQLQCTACSNLYISWTINTPPVALYYMQ